MTISAMKITACPFDMRHMVRRPPTFQRERPGVVPNKNICPRSISLVHRAVARRTCRQSAGRRWLSRCAPRTRPARCCAGSQGHHGRTTCRQARQCCQGDTGNAVDQCIDIRLPHQLPPVLHQPQLQDLGLDLDVISVGLTAWRLPPLAPQVSQVGNAALVEREAVTLPLDHAFGFELADIGPAAIKMLRQCRRADGCGLSGSRSRDGLGAGGAINGTVSAIVFVPVASR